MSPRKRFSKTSITPLKIWHRIVIPKCYFGQPLRGVSSTSADSSVSPSYWGNCYFTASIIRLVKPPAGHAVTGQIYHCMITFSGCMSCRTLPPRGASCWQLKQQIKIYKSLLKVFTKVTCFSLFSPQSFKATIMGINVSPISVS